jgi:two-component system response regulator CpxR
MTAPAILIVDDDVELAAMLAELLGADGFDAAHAASAGAALTILVQRRFDLLILDVMMPKMDGLELLRRLRAENSIPVLMLTARGEEDDRVLGLELGADDYLAKPFNPRELIARVRAILRRSEPGGMEPAMLALGSLAIDPLTSSVTVGGVPVRLTTAEFRVLEILLRAPGRVQSRAALAYHALGRPLEPFDRSIDTHVSNIRRKLGLKPGAGPDIRSLRGHGYMLIAGA